MADLFEEGLGSIDWNNFGQSFSGLSQIYQADSIQQSATANQISQIRYSGQVAAQGAMLSAEGYRKQAALIPKILNFNLDIDRLNTQRNLDAQSRQFQRLLGAQVSQIAASGASLSSGSALQIRNETINTFANRMLQTRTDAENKKRTEIFNANMQQFQLEEQASVEDYNAKLAQWNAEVQTINAKNAASVRSWQYQRSASSMIPTLFSELFQE